MRREFVWGAAAIAALLIGIGAESNYARAAAGYYEWVARLVAGGGAWEITSVDLRRSEKRSGDELQLQAFVRRHRDDRMPAARVVGRVAVGEVIETPVVFWTVLLIWPAASFRGRAARILCGIPVFCVLEAVTTGTQLMLPLAQASALLAGDADPVTLWDRWSRFLEAGGQFALALAAALIVASVARERPFVREADAGGVTQ